jgi:hypothetical protein
MENTMKILDHRYSFEHQQAIIARAQAERAAYMVKLLGQVPGVVRKVFYRGPHAKVGATKAMATAYGARC